jgi:hypothetical protein
MMRYVKHNAAGETGFARLFPASRAAHGKCANSSLNSEYSASVPTLGPDSNLQPFG